MTFYLNKLSVALAAGDLTARALTETCLSAIATEDGKRAFIEVYTDRVRIEADQIDKARQAGYALPPFAGIPLSIKDLFDLRGEVTRAGSIVLADGTTATSER